MSFPKRFCSLPRHISLYYNYRTVLNLTYLFFYIDLTKYVYFTSQLFFISRCQDVNLRKEYVNLVESVRDAGGEVKIFSSMHISGEREYYILQLTPKRQGHKKNGMSVKKPQ